MAGGRQDINRPLVVQAGMGLIVCTLERAQVEAMILLHQTSELPGQQVSIDQ